MCMSVNRSSMMRQFGVVICVVVACVLVPRALAFYEGNADVTALTEKNFQELVLQSKTTWIVEFYASYCGHCKALVPEYEKMASNLKNLISVGALDTQASPGLAQKYDIRGIPTIKVFVPGQPPVDYTGPRTAQALAQFALQYQSSAVSSLTSASVEEFFKMNEVPKVLLFTNKEKTTSLYKALSTAFHGHLAFGEIRSSEVNLCERFGVTEFPKLLIVVEDGKTMAYVGPLEFQSLAQFLVQFVQAKPSQEKDPRRSMPVQEELIGLDSQDDFQNECLSLRGFCVLVYLDEYESLDEVLPPEEQDDEDVSEEILQVRKEIREGLKAEFEEREQQNARLRELMSALMKKNIGGGVFRFFTVNAVTSREMLKRLDIVDAAPHIVAYVPLKEKYTHFFGNVLVSTEVERFLLRVRSGTIKFFNVPRGLTL